MRNHTAAPSPAVPVAPERRLLASVVRGKAERLARSVAREGAILWLRIVGMLWRIQNRLSRTCSGQAGTSTAEYAIATLAAVAFAGLLVVIMRSDEVRGFLLNIIRTALAIP